MQTKKCSKCKKAKPVSKFYKRNDRKNGYSSMCKSCTLVYYKIKWENTPKETKDARKRKYRAWFNNIKRKIFDHYGRVCVCCGETNLEFLTIDHINGGGTKHRKELGGGTAFFKWLRDNNYPNEFRVLCMNCNFAMGRFGYCPHNKRKDIS